jgi:hypothetical protein
VKIWVKVHLAKARRIKLLLIRHVGVVESILFIGERDTVQVVVSEELPN